MWLTAIRIMDPPSRVPLETQAKKILDALQVGCIVLGPNGYIVHANAPAIACLAPLLAHSVDGTHVPLRLSNDVRKAMRLTNRVPPLRLTETTTSSPQSPSSLSQDSSSRCSSRSTRNRSPRAESPRVLEEDRSASPGRRRPSAAAVAKGVGILEKHFFRQPSIDSSSSSDDSEQCPRQGTDVKARKVDELVVLAINKSGRRYTMVRSLHNTDNCVVMLLRCEGRTPLVGKSCRSTDSVGNPDSPSSDAEAEASMLSSIPRHPNIVRCFGRGYTRSTPAAFAGFDNWMLMEYCDWGSAQTILRTGPANEDVVVDLLYQCLLGLAHLHALGFYHRDIKPANVLLMRDGVAKLADFGVARRVTSPDHKHETVMGTPAYMCPEMYRGEKYDGGVDVWSLGFLVVALLNGQEPWAGVDIVQIPSRMASGDMPRLGVASKRMRAIVDQMLCLDPANRPTPSQLLRKRIFTKRRNALAEYIRDRLL